MEDIGTVTAAHDAIIEVAIKPHGGCSSCNRKNYCAPGEKGAENITMQVRNTLGAVVGDKVEIKMHATVAALASFTVFGVPLLAAIGGYFIGAAGSGGQERGALCSIGALIGTFGIFWVMSRLYPHTMRFMPQTSRIIR